MSRKSLTFLSTLLAIVLLSGCSNKNPETKIPIKSENNTKMAEEKAEAERKAEEARQKAEEARKIAEAEEARRKAEEAHKIKENDYKSLLSAIDEIRSSEIATGKADLSIEIQDNLDLIVEFLKKYPEASVKISSYTDSKGSENINLKLSQERADNIAKYLINQGIDENRIDAQGFGEANFIDLINPDSSINRRTEVELIPNF